MINGTRHLLFRFGQFPGDYYFDPIDWQHFTQLALS